MSRFPEALKDTVSSGSSPPRGRQPAVSSPFPAAPVTPTRRRNSAPTFSPSSHANILRVYPFDGAQAIVVNNLSVFDREIRTAGAFIHVDFYNNINAFVLRVVVPTRQFEDAPPLTRGVLSDHLELGRLTLFVAEDQGRDGSGYFSVRTRPEIVALERQLASVEVPEIMVAGVVALSDPILLSDAGLDHEVVSFNSLDGVSQAAVRRWCERYGSGRPNRRSDNIEIPDTAPVARSRETTRLLRELRILRRGSRGTAIIQWIITREIRRFRGYIEEHPLYEQATNLLQRFQQLFNEVVLETTTHNNIRASSNQESVGGRIWVRFDINGVVERPTHTYTRNRARNDAAIVGAFDPQQDVRNRLTRIDWQIAQELFFRAFPALTVTTVNRTDSAGRMTTVTTINNAQTPASRTAGRLAQFGLSTPPSPTPDATLSPTQVSFFADTDCRSSQTPSEYAAYHARHASARRQWPEAIRASCHDEREASPGISHYEDQNRPRDEWHVIGGNGGAAILSGHPGGIDGSYLQSLGFPITRGGELKRRLTAASYRSPSQRENEAKRMRRFPTPEPYNGARRALGEIRLIRAEEDQEEEVLEFSEDEEDEEDEEEEGENEMDWDRLNEGEGI
ncbi:hypothetical protein TWF679_010913 [Orbilia oligospora]|uniref:Uncharacterized protein n=1 Tax=Orbilia oligospora TaxID=2813651 RepID=A0A8H8VIF8_ORBOL|nr:hypothetical protein TWF679_010913 [Orbilia oligospora]